MFSSEIVQFFLLIFLYLFSLTVCVKQSMSWNLFLVSLTLLLLTVVIYRFTRTKTNYLMLENRKINFFFIFNSCIFYVIFFVHWELLYCTVPSVFFFLSLMSNYFYSFLPEDIKTIMVTVKKDNQTLEDHFKNDFLIFDYV